MADTSSDEDDEECAPTQLILPTQQCGPTQVVDEDTEDEEEEDEEDAALFVAGRCSAVQDTMEEEETDEDSSESEEDDDSRREAADEETADEDESDSESEIEQELEFQAVPSRLEALQRTEASDDIVTERQVLEALPPPPPEEDDEPFEEAIASSKAPKKKALTTTKSGSAVSSRKRRATTTRKKKEKATRCNKDQETDNVEDDDDNDDAKKKEETALDEEIKPKKKARLPRKKKKKKDESLLGLQKKKKKQKKLKKKGKHRKQVQEDVAEVVDAALAKFEEEEQAPSSTAGHRASPEELEAERLAQAEVEERRAVLRELQADEDLLRAQAAARRTALAERIKEKVQAEEEAKARAARLRLHDSDSDSDSDFEIEIIGAPSTKKSKKSSILNNPRKALGLQLKQRVRRSCLEHFTKHAALGTTDPDAYFRHLQALEAQRCLKMNPSARPLPTRADPEGSKSSSEKNAVPSPLKNNGTKHTLSQTPQAPKPATEEDQDAFFNVDDLFDDNKSQSLQVAPISAASAMADFDEESRPLETGCTDEFHSKKESLETSNSQDTSRLLAISKESSRNEPAVESKSEEPRAHDHKASSRAQALFDDSQPLDFGIPESAALEFEQSPPEDEEDEEKEVTALSLTESEAVTNIADDNNNKQEREKKDRSAAYRAILERDAKSARRKHWALEMEAEESDDEIDGQRGLGDFGFGIPEAAKKKDDLNDKEKEDIVPTADDLEAIVDELSDDEKGNEDAADDLNFAYAKQRDRAEMAEMLRNVREGFDARGRGLADRAATTTLSKLVALDPKAKREAKRLGLDDGADDEDADDDQDETNIDNNGEHVEEEEEEEEAVDEEAAFAELISNELKQRHLGAAALRRKRRELDEASSDDEDDEPISSQTKVPAEDSDEEIEREAEARSKAWAKRVKRRRQLEQAAAQRRARDPRDVAKSLLDRDENSQFILGILQREDSLHGGVSAETNNKPRAPSRSSSLPDDSTLLEFSTSLPVPSTHGSQRRQHDASSRIGPRAGSFFRSNSLLADAAGPAPSNHHHQPQKGPSASASGRLVASHRPAVVFDVSSNSNSGFHNNDLPHPNKRKATPPIRRLDLNVNRKSSNLANTTKHKKPRFDATASIWSHVAANRFG